MSQCAPQKTFGLVFEDHAPEPVLVDGERVQWGTPVAASITSTGQVSTDEREDAPVHRIIKGENLRCLQALTPEYAGKVDLIYIDPPYNTGNKDWKYNDAYVDSRDTFRHSKWLSFMDHRLRAAKKLLADTGVIFVAIGDDEHHRLRILMDEIFGESNFIANVVWNGARRGDARYVSAATDYMLVYARSRKTLDDSGARWREPKDGVEQIIEAGRRVWDESGHNAKEATLALRAWFKSLPAGHPSKAGGRATTNYKWVDDTARPGEVFYETALSWPGEGGFHYDVLHPVTGKPVREPKTGWSHTPESLQELIDANMILWGEDESKLIYRKKFITEAADQPADSVFSLDRRSATARLEKLLGDKRFPFPKDHTVLMRWFRLAAPKDALIVDFFGGSGSSAEAVARLNAEDGGTRTCVLVTNNELSRKDEQALAKAGHRPGTPEWEAHGVYEHVTRPRLTTLATGVREDDSAYPNPAPANFVFENLALSRSAFGLAVNVPAD